MFQDGYCTIKQLSWNMLEPQLKTNPLEHLEFPDIGKILDAERPRISLPVGTKGTEALGTLTSLKYHFLVLEYLSEEIMYIHICLYYSITYEYDFRVHIYIYIFNICCMLPGILRRTLPNALLVFEPS